MAREAFYVHDELYFYLTGADAIGKVATDLGAEYYADPALPTGHYEIRVCVAVPRRPRPVVTVVE
jgi:hypothetical protein